MRASFRGAAHVGARARGAHAFGAERVARSDNQAAAGAWSWRVARRGDGSQRLPRPVHKARSALAGPRAQSAGAERERECDAATPNQAPGAQRPRHRRQARGRPGSQAAPPLWPLWAAGPCTDALCLHTLGGFCLLAQLEDCDIGIIHMVYVAKKRRGSSRKYRLRSVLR